MRTTAGPVPAERTKMSAPAGLWTVCDLKVDGRTGWAATTFAETAASAIASRVAPVILAWRLMELSSSVVGVSINIRALASMISGTWENYFQIERSRIFLDIVM